MTTIPGVGEQISGTNVRGILCFTALPPDLQNAEDSTQAADFTRWEDRHGQRDPSLRWKMVPIIFPENPAALTAQPDRKQHGWAFLRAATETERRLLDHLGHVELPEDLQTQVEWLSGGVRRRTWPQIESETTE